MRTKTGEWLFNQRDSNNAEPDGINMLSIRIRKERQKLKDILEGSEEYEK